MGSGSCIMYAPTTFAHDDETKAVLIGAFRDQLESVRIAVEACPTGALTIEDGGV